MNDKPLRPGTPVRITSDRHAGWRGKVLSRFYRFYQIELSHDANGDRLAARHVAGPFVQRELERL